MKNRGYRGLWKNEKARVLRKKWKKRMVMVRNEKKTEEETRNKNQWTH